MVSMDDLLKVVQGLFKEPTIGPPKSMTSFFSAQDGPIWIKFCRLVQNDMSTAVKSKPGVEFQYGGRLGEFNGI